MRADAAGDALVVRAPCKVNLALEVLARRPDGFHEIRTVMHAVDLCDEMALRLLPGREIRLTCAAPGVPAGGDNLIVRAALLMRERFGAEQGVEVNLRKRVPVGGGLGGGSSDAAVALLALNDLWNVGASPAQLGRLAAELGSDVPFFLWGGTALCEGRGERVSPVADGPVLHFVLVMPGLRVSTAEVYAAARNGLTTRAVGCNNVLKALADGDVERIGSALRNDLEGPALRLHGALQELGRQLRDFSEACHARGLLLSGSGSSFFMLVDGEEEAAEAAELLRPALGVPCAAVRSVSAWGSRIRALSAWRGER
jgi:4-diphosphocytidyl-2-C-methyl-D-erythritol kinase